MRITIHGHRPAFLRSANDARSATTSAASEAQNPAPAAPGSSVRSINLGFLKLKIHRQTAVQATLVAQHQAHQLAQNSMVRPAAPSSRPASPLDLTVRPPVSPSPRSAPSTPQAASPLTNRDLQARREDRGADPDTAPPAPGERRSPSGGASGGSEMADHTHSGPRPRQFTDLPELSLSPAGSPASNRTTAGSLSSRTPPTPSPRRAVTYEPLRRPGQSLDLPFLPFLPSIDDSPVARAHQLDTPVPGTTEPQGLHPIDAGLSTQGPREDAPPVSSQPFRRPRSGAIDETEPVRLSPLPPPPRGYLSRRSLANAVDLLQPRAIAPLHHSQDPSIVSPMRLTTRSSLAAVVARWSNDQAPHAGEAFRQWNTWANEPGADAFIHFLHRLSRTVNASDARFRARVSEWLNHLAQQPELRRDSFELSRDARTDCQDRVSLTLNNMRKLRLTSDVSQGAYDQRLTELISLARGMFRLDQLERISFDHASSLENPDVIEVFLAYQVQLRTPLSLPIDTVEMRFFNVSGVSQDDIEQARSRVLEAEQQDFVNYLANDWQPWQAVVERIAPQAYNQAREEILAAVGDDPSSELQTRLRPAGLQDDPDAQRQTGAQITREINGRLTRDVLASHGLLALLDPPPVTPPMQDPPDET